MKNLSNIRLAYHYASRDPVTLVDRPASCLTKIIIEINCELIAPFSIPDISQLNREVTSLLQRVMPHRGECQVKNVMIL